MVSAHSNSASRSHCILAACSSQELTGGHPKGFGVFDYCSWLNEEAPQHAPCSADRSTNRMNCFRSPHLGPPHFLSRTTTAHSPPLVRLTTLCKLAFREPPAPPVLISEVLLGIWLLLHSTLRLESVGRVDHPLSLWQGFSSESAPATRCLGTHQAALSLATGKSGSSVSRRELDWPHLFFSHFLPAKHHLFCILPGFFRHPLSDLALGKSPRQALCLVFFGSNGSD